MPMVALLMAIAADSTCCSSTRTFNFTTDQAFAAQTAKEQPWAVVARTDYKSIDVARLEGLLSGDPTSIFTASTTARQHTTVNPILASYPATMPHVQEINVMGCRHIRF